MLDIPKLCASTCEEGKDDHRDNGIRKNKDRHSEVSELKRCLDKAAEGDPALFRVIKETVEIAADVAQSLSSSQSVGVRIVTQPTTSAMSSDVVVEE